jgi:hypothetical protein
MSRTSMQDKSLWRALLSSKVGLVFVVTFFCVSLSHSSGQSQDTTPPVWRDFSISPVLFDTTTQDATVSFCVAAADDLSGVGDVGVRADSPSSMPISGFFGISLNFHGMNEATVCGSAVISVGSPFEIQPLVIQLTDRVGNTRLVGNPSHPICAFGLFGQCENLCDLGLPCVVENRSLTGVEDTTPPAITVSATPETLGPPNGKRVSVTISGTIKDAESGVNASTAAYAVIDEYGLIQPNGPIQVAMDGSYAFTIKLQASRKGNDRDGRQYTITVSAQDNEGNQGSKSTVVTVPQRLQILTIKELLEGKKR